MMTKRVCAYRHPDARPCGAPPLRDGSYCRMHDPAFAADVQEARRLGGIRRKREVTIDAAYDLEGIGSVPALQRLVDIVIVDALGLENTVARGRLLLQAAQAAAKLLEVGVLEERVKALEAAVQANRDQTAFLAAPVDAFALDGDERGRL
jgi:hypothetical protein